ncbi:uncharacterized protein LOC131874499 [Cryptomeria japonica]|uniref:uncharacterized protein LOC131874499 n=1 Tax=Cryptomeria japonica TaxID=3369 RepID=UPI0027DA1E7B|nr:uncharacterized protein LOC131874499 [Cryptomeria japonica]
MATISSVKGAQNMAIDLTKKDGIVYVLEKTEGLDQKWNEASSEGPNKNSVSYQNVLTKAFMYPDDRQQNTDGVRTKQGSKYQWTKQTAGDHFQLMIQSGDSIKAIKFLANNQPVKLADLDPDDDAFLWDITS